MKESQFWFMLEQQ